MAHYAVLSGDIIHSSRAAQDALEETMSSLGAAAVIVGNWQGSSVRFTRFRGDGWQILLDQPGLALRASLFFLARLKSDKSVLPSRIAIGLGAVSHLGSHLGKGDLSDASGPAFAAAGHTLDVMRRGRRLELRDHPLSTLVTLCDALAQRWTQSQAEVLALALMPDAPPQSEIARQIGAKGQQVVSARLDAAGFWAIEAAVASFEAHFQG